METQHELLRTDQEPDPSEAKLTLSLTGNPWTDFGIVSLSEELWSSDPRFLIEKPLLTENAAMITIDISDVEMIKTWFNQRLRDKWNNIYHPSPIAKALKRAPIQENGFIKPDEKISIDDAARKTIKDKLKRSNIEDEELLVKRRSNFVGVPGNIKTIQNNLVEMVDEIVENLISSRAQNFCEVSGLAFKQKQAKQVTQYANPFANQYHNNPVRGTTRRVGYGKKISPIHYLVNLLTTLCPSIPFVCETEIALVLPVIPDLHLLSKVYTRLVMSDNLKDFSDSEETYIFTNLRELRPPYDDYSLAIYIFHNIFYRFSKEEDRSFFEEIDEPEQTIPLLTRWVKIPFTSPSSNPNQKNIRFGNFHYIEVDHRLYDFIRPIPFGDEVEIQLVPDIIARISPVLIKGKRDPRGENSLRYLSKAITTSDTQLMKVAIFNLWKHTDAINVRLDLQPEAPHPLRMLRYFIQHFLEVNAVLNEKMREDLRRLGFTIGSVFSRDVTLISKLYNVSSEGAFRAVLSQIMFRLYKIGLDGKAEDGKLRVKVKNEDKSITRVSHKRVTRILDELTPENWQNLAETLSTFTSLSAFNANFSQRQAKGGKNG